ncbi:glutaminase A [Desulfolucanica intricata]|uniref:glutaminase A n=1 Tax=Desulfolucanica intricata TaxID=1285191 RepID=UPI0008334BDD|nr:glutaminase A [Desulfolucanica intricata]
MQLMLQEILESCKHLTRKGQVAQYIPALGDARSDCLGITVIDMNGHVFSVGDCQEKFTMQSVSKLITLMLALIDNGIDGVFSKVGMEPTGDPFNSIIKLETLEPAKPLNPMINAGAIATTSLIKGSGTAERLERILSLIRKLSKNPHISYNERVYLSEKETGDRNRSLAYFMRGIDIVKGDVEEHLDLYFLQCAIEVTTRDLANIALCIANMGKDPYTKEVVVPEHIVRIVKTFMVTCGMYDASGEFAIRVGIPAKSGVSGVIMACVPDRYGIGVVGPSLDDKGNSIAGIKVLEELSKRLKLSIF